MRRFSDDYRVLEHRRVLSENQTMSKKPTPSEADIIAAARKRLQEMGPGALNRLEELSNQTKSKTVAKKAKRVVGKYKGKK